MMFEEIRDLLIEALQLDERNGNLTPDTPLLGSIPEFDSMAVVTVITLLEERFQMTVDDDDIDADVFLTVGSVVEFVQDRVG